MRRRERPIVDGGQRHQLTAASALSTIAGMAYDETRAREEIVAYSRKLHAAGLVCATDGNLSIRLDGDRVLITPSALRKEDMFLEAPILIDMNGEPLHEKRRPSTEYKIHLEAYRQRPDIHAVIHAHPPRAIAFTLTDTPLDTCLLPEVVVTVGRVPVAPYARPSTEDLPASIRDLVARTDVVMLARHGSVTLGGSLGEAFIKLERLEKSAEILMYAHQLGGTRPFSPQEMKELQELREFYRVTTQIIPCFPGDSEQ